MFSGELKLEPVGGPCLAAVSAGSIVLFCGQPHRKCFLKWFP